ncbi:LIC13255 family lipoprotein [Leptospira ryugenii]|uniref:LIC13255 family lipoprotein n=1 Tax=Leptospira ryugenii TaxID=1917863 RepID=UPI000D59AA8C|nr:hypothetical protein [Leptospira ryugenii]
MKPSFYICLLCFLCFCTQNKDEIFYQPAEANAKIVQAYALKDLSCGKSHILKTVFLGRVKISDLNRCIKAIEITSCTAWQADNPTPDSCKRINYILN